MSNDMVMRSVYLRPDEDARLRLLAFENNVTKSDLIRSAISAKLVEWIKGQDKELILRDLELGRRPSAAERAEKARAEDEARGAAEAAKNAELEKRMLAHAVRVASAKREPRTARARRGSVRPAKLVENREPLLAE